MKLKVFYIGYFWQNQGCFTEILTKIYKEQINVKFSSILSDPNFLNSRYDR